jgi:hypothetical protein
MNRVLGRLWCFLGTVSLLCSCGGSSSGGVPDVPNVHEGIGPDVGSAVDAPVLDVPAQADGLPTDVDSDLPPLEDAAEVADVVACDPAASAFGCPCQGNGDCLSGWCVHHMGERVCSDPCVDTCPQAWDCVQVGATDPVFLCVSRFSHLCLPCTTNADCESVSGTRDVCVDYGAELGRFCGGACGQGQGCPEGFACEDTLNWDGKPVTQCVVDGGVCGCSETAMDQALSTPCERSNEWGTCAGERVCGVDGLGDCDAPTPSEEICFNLIDDDCDGETDPWELCAPCVCGDGACEPDRCGEGWDDQVKTCATDCAVCGDLVCDAGEGVEICPADCCGACGDGLCKGGQCGEDPLTCPEDCGIGACGDGTCDPGEDPVDCVSDCERFVCGNHACEPGEGIAACPEDCAETCGDCACDGGESYASCPTDCGFCGDGYCIAQCPHLTAEDGETCGDDCCATDCEGRACGDDGCGGSCGLCPVFNPCFAACHDGQCGPLVEEEASCDGVDDDCDGQTDEDFVHVDAASGAVGLGEPCGLGACAGGVAVCAPDGAGLVCSSVAGGERCDGVDNDCDGLTDSDDALDLQAADPRPCERQAGACAGATKPAWACVDGAWRACDDSVYLGFDPAYEAGAELSCDELDNDCDEATDEDFTLALHDGVEVDALGGACGVGVCAGGQVTCREDGAGLICSTAGYATPEVCDWKDNDCDGLTDGADDLVLGDDGLTLPACEIQVGVCAGATRAPARCVEGAWIACAPEDYAAASGSYEAGLELSCDGLDNDCDGAADEDFPLMLLDGSAVSGVGQPCGVGACAGGETVCDEQGAGIVCESEAQAAPEACNGLDDDCDGLVDTADGSFGGLASPATPPCGRQDGVCAGAVTPSERCAAGAWQDCVTEDYLAHAPTYQAAAELKCDGLDEDCDGSVDEDFVLTQADGTLVSGAGVACGVGACAGGFTICDEAGAGIVCSSSGDTITERCNGLDDDCDGFTDEDFPVGQACGLGACAGGVHECSASGQGTLCNTLASGSDPKASPEICDGLDNDCDGLVDAKDPDLNQGVDGAVIVLCQLQQGICAGANKPPERCVDGAWQACSAADYLAHAPAYQPEAEQVCDGLDEDCDGDTDEGFELTTLDGHVVSEVGAACGVGVCAGGETACDDGGMAIICSSEGEAGPERCNGDDDDCDGLTDEGFSPGEACGQGACAGGVLECTEDGEGAVCSTLIGGSASVVAPEVCDGVDNDCDGLTDADDGDLMGVGGGPVACERQDGVCEGALKPASRCVAGAWEPCAAVDYLAHAADYEDGVEARCDAVDEDCDGQVDEDFALEMPDGSIFAGVNTPCGVGACAGGITLCGEADAGIVCSSGGNVSPDLCNEIDDDCDGLTDEDFSLGQSCGDGECSGGQMECSQDQEDTVCSTLAGGSNQQITAETCDGLDDDCDGDTDETGAELCGDQGLCTIVSCAGAAGCKYTDKSCPEDDFCTNRRCDPANGACETYVDPDNAGEICESDGSMCTEHRCSGSTCKKYDANQGENCTSDPQTKWDKVCWNGECAGRWVQVDGGDCTEDRAKWNRKMYRFRGCSSGITYADAVANCASMEKCGEYDWGLLKQDDDLYPIINWDPAVWNGDCAAEGKKTSIHDDFKHVRGGSKRTWVTGNDGSSKMGCTTLYDNGISCVVKDKNSLLPWACVAVISPE